MGAEDVPSAEALAEQLVSAEDEEELYETAKSVVEEYEDLSWLRQCYYDENNLAYIAAFASEQGYEGLERQAEKQQRMSLKSFMKKGVIGYVGGNVGVVGYDQVFDNIAKIQPYLPDIQEMLQQVPVVDQGVTAGIAGIGVVGLYEARKSTNTIIETVPDRIQESYLEDYVTQIEWELKEEYGVTPSESRWIELPLMRSKLKSEEDY